MANGATDIMVVCNNLTTLVDEYLTKIETEGLHGQHVPLRHVVKTTPSSMHSMYELRHLLRETPPSETDNRFILTTVDTFFSEARFAEYVKAFSESGADGMMAVTDFIDDEKPLYVQVTPTTSPNPNPQTTAGRIVNFLDKDEAHQCRYISAGIYGLTAPAIDTLERCIENGQSRMRNFQRALISDGLHLEAWSLGRVTDIDHASDIPQSVLGIYREARSSPNMGDRDRAIMDVTLALLNAQGYYTSTVSEEQLQQQGHLPTADLYLSMARSRQVLQLLDAVGDRTINAPDAVRACIRRSYVAENDAPAPCWVKRIDTCAEQADDVMFCKTDADKAAAIARLQQRGIDDVVAQPHHEGDIVKFYGVQGTDFFYAFYPIENGHVKFSIPDTSTVTHHFPYDADSLHRQADAIASAYAAPVYGGDAVVAADSTIYIIDFNDWPSYSACRNEAARAIAQVALRQMERLKAHERGQGYILDYGATLDTHGEHWSKVIWRGYQKHNVPITWEQFWEAYKLTERRLGQGDIIMPTDTFHHTLYVKIGLQFDFLAQSGAWDAPADEKESLRHSIVESIYAETVEVTSQSRERLQCLRDAGVPMVLVSNFYGNVETVLDEFKLRPYFAAVIESAQAGYRKPDVRLWQLGVDALKKVAPQLHNSDITVVGDSQEKDINPAKQLGCCTFHVTPDNYDFLHNTQFWRQSTVLCS